MYVINFRIPFYVMGQKSYVNGAAWSRTSYRKGEGITVQPNLSCSCDDPSFYAEVVETGNTGMNKTADDYAYKIKDLSFSS